MPSKDQDLAIAAAEAGAAVVRERYGSTLARFEKDVGDFATAADVEAERAILDVLRVARPHDAVVGEESGRTGAKTADRTWLVDPLCGTLNFAAQTTLVAVNVALRTDSGIAVAPQPTPLPARCSGRTAFARMCAAMVWTRNSNRRPIHGWWTSISTRPSRTAPRSAPPGFSWMRSSPCGSGHVWCPRPSPWPGSPPGGEPPMSPTAICRTVCTSPAGSLCAKPPGAW